MTVLMRRHKGRACPAADPQQDPCNAAVEMHAQQWPSTTGISYMNKMICFLERSYPYSSRPQVDLNCLPFPQTHCVSGHWQQCYTSPLSCSTLTSVAPLQTLLVWSQLFSPRHINISSLIQLEPCYIYDDDIRYVFADLNTTADTSGESFSDSRHSVRWLHIAQTLHVNLWLCRL